MEAQVSAIDELARSKIRTIERERKQEAIEAARDQAMREASQSATKGDIEELTKRFDGLIKAIWAVALLLASIGGTFLASHI